MSSSFLDNPPEMSMTACAALGGRAVVKVCCAFASTIVEADGCNGMSCVSGRLALHSGMRGGHSRMMSQNA